MWQRKSPRRRPPGNQPCRKRTSAKSATDVLPTQLVETVTKKSAASKRSLSRNLSEARKSKEAWMKIGCPAPRKLKPLKCKKDKMLRKKNKLRRRKKAFLMNRRNLHGPPPYSATNKRKLYILLCPRTISCQPWAMTISIPSFGD